jgi:MOSC domain-containing protein YiiM
MPVKTKRPDVDLPTLKVRALFVREPKLEKTFGRRQIAANESVEVTAKGVASEGVLSPDWAATTKRPLREKDVLERAVLLQSEAHWADVLSEFEADGARRGALLRAPMPKSMEPGEWGEQITISGASADELCIGDVLSLEATSDKSRKRTKLSKSAFAGANEVVLQVCAPRRPCTSVDQKFGSTWGSTGVRAYCAKTARAGFFCRVLHPGKLTSGATFHITERPQPSWPVSRVSKLLYGLEGADANPAYYELPGFAKRHFPKWRETDGSGGGGKEVLVKWAANGGTEADLRALAAMPELADLEWREEIQAMLAEVDRRSCAVM